MELELPPLKKPRIIIPEPPNSQVPIESQVQDTPQTVNEPPPLGGGVADTLPNPQPNPNLYERCRQVSLFLIGTSNDVVRNDIFNRNLEDNTIYMAFNEIGDMTNIRNSTNPNYVLPPEIRDLNPLGEDHIYDVSVYDPLHSQGNTRNDPDDAPPNSLIDVTCNIGNECVCIFTPEHEETLSWDEIFPEN